MWTSPGASASTLCACSTPWCASCWSDPPALRTTSAFGCPSSTASIMGPLALIAREQPTVRAVLEAVSRYRSLHADVTTVPLEDVGDITIVRLVQTWPSPGPDRQA